MNKCLYLSHSRRRKREGSPSNEPVAPHLRRGGSQTHILNHLVPDCGLEFKEDYVNNSHGFLYGRESWEEGTFREQEVGCLDEGLRQSMPRYMQADYIPMYYTFSTEQ
jgi:hypothetical protein